MSTDPNDPDLASPLSAGQAELPPSATGAEPFDEAEPDRSLDQSAEERRSIYFNSERLPEAHLNYVAWLCVMGANEVMSQSLLKSAGAIGRLHVAILMKRNHDLRTSPFMEGSYITTPWQHTMLQFLRAVFEELAYNFTRAREDRHRFLPRCGLSFGNVILGTNITPSVSRILGAY